MKTQHTPGPFGIYGPFYGEDVTPPEPGKQWLEIAELDDDGYPGNEIAIIVNRLGEPSSEQWANARLIAAAPDLLEAASDALESLRRLPDAPDAYRVTCIGQLEAAVAKATGGEA